MLELEHTGDEINLKLTKEEMKKPTITKEDLVLWLKQIQTMSLETKEHKQRLIDCFVNAVYLYDDKLVITFNYKDASKTVTLKGGNGSIIECSGAPKKRSEPTAARGGERKTSEWQWSARRKPAVSGAVTAGYSNKTAIRRGRDYVHLDL